MLQVQIIYLFILAIPIACIAWTVTHEEVFRELRNYCERQSENCKNKFVRKFFYLFTCEYCFSHYVTIIFLFITNYTLLYTNWRGYLIAGFALVWVANIYMSLYARIKIVIKADKVDIKIKEEELNKNAEIEKKLP